MMFIFLRKHQETERVIEHCSDFWYMTCKKEIQILINFICINIPIYVRYLCNEFPVRVLNEKHNYY